MPALCGLVGGVFLLVLPLDPDRRVEEALSADPDGAEALCSRALGFSPYDYRAAWVRARVSRDVEVADERFSVAADLWPAHPGLQREVGMWFWEGKEVDQSARCFRRFFEQDPGAVESVMKEIWDPEIPVASYEELLPENPVAAAVMAGFLVKRDRWKDAMALFDRRWKGSVRAADLFAIRLQQEGQWGLEATVRERRLERKSDPAAWLATGRTWHRLGRTRRALECADMTVRIDPGNSGGWILSGDVHLGSGEKMKAIESYTRALLLSPENLSLSSPCPRKSAVPRLMAWAPSVGAGSASDVTMTLFDPESFSICSHASSPWP